MKIECEAYGLKFRKDAVIEAMKTGNFGIRLRFMPEDDSIKQEVVITTKEAVDLMKSIEKSLESVKQCKFLKTAKE